MRPAPEAAPDTRDLARDLDQAIKGEVRFDAGSRGLYATDASNYRQPPIGVVSPLDAEDVIRTLYVCRAHEVPVLARGAGTSLAGQCCNHAVVMDLSRHMNQVLEIDPERRIARVQPGVVVDQLNDAAREHGLLFAPDPATHTHCTLGGMLGNNSCGIHSVMSEFYGPGPRTSDHVIELDVVTYDGVRLRVGATPDDELERMLAQDGRPASIYAALRALRDTYGPLIRERYPVLPRRVSGYNLPALLPENDFHVARVLVGSESTCVILLEATLQLIPRQPARAVVLLGYPSVYHAADHILSIRDFRPTGCEGMDDRLIGYNRKKGMNAGALPLLPKGEGWLIVELGGDSEDEVADRARRMMDALGRAPDAPSMKLFTDPEIVKQIWDIRESGLGATAFVPGEPATWPGWEDSAVPPHRLGRYLRDLRALLDRHGYACSLYGHFAHGCVHTRIDFELSTAEGIDNFRRFTEAAAHLVVSHGGSISGEHGDGQARGDLLPIMYGPELVSAFREFKAIWDPERRMNPGKITGGARRTDALRLASYQPWQARTHYDYHEDGGDFGHAALRCVGVGKCRQLGGGTMCPSYMVTHEEKHCTRGRARLLYEMMQGEVIRDHWRSAEVMDALDLCLSCKACKRECPVNVDMALYKSEFVAHHYRGRLRPRHAYAFGLIHRWARMASYVPWLANAITQTPGLRVLARAIAGMAPERSIPPFARKTFQRMVRGRTARGGNGRSVLLWPDTFNNHFYPYTLMAGLQVLESAGYHVIVPREPLCCGRPLYEFGMIDRARGLWQRTLRVLGEHVAAGTPVVGLEPSCVAAFRDELPALFPDVDRARALSELTMTLGEFLVDVARDYEAPEIIGRGVLHGHCHHKAIMRFDADVEVLRRTGLELEVLDSGCCGMAGAFGFERHKYAISMAAGERVLLPAVRAASRDTLILTDGFSCREQIRHGTDRMAMHLAEVLQAGLPRNHEDF